MERFNRKQAIIPLVGKRVKRSIYFCPSFRHCGEITHLQEPLRMAGRGGSGACVRRWLLCIRPACCMPRAFPRHCDHEQHPHGPGAASMNPMEAPTQPHTRHPYTLVSHPVSRHTPCTARALPSHRCPVLTSMLQHLPASSNTSPNASAPPKMLQHRPHAPNTKAPPQKFQQSL